MAVSLPGTIKSAHIYKALPIAFRRVVVKPRNGAADHRFAQVSSRHTQWQRTANRATPGLRAALPTPVWQQNQGRNPVERSARAGQPFAFLRAPPDQGVGLTGDIRPPGARSQ